MKQFSMHTPRFQYCSDLKACALASLWPEARRRRHRDTPKTECKLLRCQKWDSDLFSRGQATSVVASTIKFSAMSTQRLEVGKISWAQLNFKNLSMDKRNERWESLSQRKQTIDTTSTEGAVFIDRLWNCPLLGTLARSMEQLIRSSRNRTDLHQSNANLPFYFGHFLGLRT
jgi:hypothetical protein